VNHQALIAVTIGVCLITIHQEQREHRNQLNALPEDIRNLDILGPIVQNIHGQDTLGNGIHDIAAGKFEHGVVDKIIR